MGLFNFGKSSKENLASWTVILKNAPDKKSEEALMLIFTERLNVPGDDALKVIRSAPIILFDERSSREAEQIKLILNKTGARTAISNDPSEFKKFPKVAWPKRIAVEDLGAETEIGPIAPTPLSPPTSQSVFKEKVIVPTPPKPRMASPIPPAPPSPIIPTPSTPPPSLAGVSEEWKNKYESLQKSYLNAVDKLEKKEVEIKTAQDRLKKLESEVAEKERAVREREQIKQQAENFQGELQKLRGVFGSLEKEKQEALTAREQAEKASEASQKENQKLQREVQRLQEEHGGLEKENAGLRSEKANLISELDKIRRDIERLLGNGKGVASIPAPSGRRQASGESPGPSKSSPPNLAPGPQPIIPTLPGGKTKNPPQKGPGQIGIIPPAR